jgi:hypothetical protein
VLRWRIERLTAIRSTERSLHPWGFTGCCVAFENGRLSRCLIMDGRIRVITLLAFSGSFGLLAHILRSVHLTPDSSCMTRLDRITQSTDIEGITQATVI